MPHLVLLLKHQQRGVVGRIVLVNLPGLELQGERRHVGEHLVSELHVVAGDVGHHPEGEHLRLVSRDTGPLPLVQDDLRQRSLLGGALSEPPLIRPILSGKDQLCSCFRGGS